MGWCSAVLHVADIITPVLVGWMFGRKGGSDGYVWGLLWSSWRVGGVFEGNKERCSGKAGRGNGLNS